MSTFKFPGSGFEKEFSVLSYTCLASKNLTGTQPTAV